MSKPSLWRPTAVHADKVACAIEVGASTTKCMIAGLTRGEGVLDVLGAALTASQGVRDGEIVSVDHCQAAIETVLERAQEEAQIYVLASVIALSGSQTGLRLVHGEHEAEKIQTALRATGQVSLNIAPAEEVDHDAVRRAMTARIEQVEALSKAVTQAGPAPRFMGAGPLAIAYSGVSEERWQSGAAVIDLGARHTTLSLVGEGQLKLVRIFQIGGRHITLDIAHAMQLSAESAERLKFASGAYFTKGIENDPMELEALRALAPVKVKPSSAIEVISARCEEIFSLVKKELDALGENSRLPVILVGGGASLNGVDEVARRVLGRNVRIRHKPAPGQALHRRPVFATAKGLVKMALARADQRSMATYGRGAGAWAARTAKWMSGRF